MGAQNHPHIQRELRHRAGMSLRQLSACSHVSVSELSAIERRTRKPTVKTLRRIADALSLVELSTVLREWDD